MGGRKTERASEGETEEWIRPRDGGKRRERAPRDGSDRGMEANGESEGGREEGSGSPGREGGREGGRELRLSQAIPSLSPVQLCPGRLPYLVPPRPPCLAPPRPIPQPPRPASPAPRARPSPFPRLAPPFPAPLKPARSQMSPPSFSGCRANRWPAGRVQAVKMTAVGSRAAPAGQPFDLRTAACKAIVCVCVCSGAGPALPPRAAGPAEAVLAVAWTRPASEKGHQHLPEPGGPGRRLDAFRPGGGPRPPPGSGRRQSRLAVLNSGGRFGEGAPGPRPPDPT